MRQQTSPSSPGMPSDECDDDEHHHEQAWAKSSSISATSVSASAPTTRSATSPLAVSVSGPGFHAAGVLGLAVSSLTKREFRGKCLYQSRKCENERALKRNGKAHNLCDEHRTKQNQHQRKFDAKKFSRKRRRDSGGEDQSGDEDDDEDTETVGDADRRLHSKEVLKRESPPQPAVPKPQRKIRRFDGAKHADRRPRHERETTSQQIKAEVQVMGGGASPAVRSSAVHHLHVPEHYRGHPASFFNQHQHQSREYPSRPPPPPGYSTLHSPAEQQQYHYQHSGGAHERDQSGYYRPVLESTSRGGPGTLSGVHPSPRHTSFVDRSMVPLRPLSAIVSTSSSRIPVGNQENRRPTPEHVYIQAGGGRERRHTDGGLEDRVGFGERRASYDGGRSEAGAGAQQNPPQYQAERSSYAPSRYSTSETSSARLPSPQAPGTAYTPQYSPSELIAASILVPSATPVARHPQYPDTSAGVTAQLYHHHHTSVSPRGMPPMYHPSSYAISPHHARLQASGSSSTSYLRAQQMQISAERERRETPSDPQQRNSPPSAGVPSRMLPSLATQVPIPISSAPAGSGAPFSAKQVPTPRALPTARELAEYQRQQYRPQDGHQPAPQHQQQARHHQAMTHPVAPVLPSLAPFRNPRNSSRASQQHYPTSASS